MSRLNYTVVLALIAAAFLLVDLAIALRTGRARGLSGTITREREPDKFKRHIYINCAALALCAVMILWAVFSPFAFR
jgi:hypothetical protein